VIVIPLTFGSRSDWAQNVRAAGGCSIRLLGHDYAAIEPESLTLAEAAPLLRAAFSPVERPASGCSASSRSCGCRLAVPAQR